MATTQRSGAYSGDRDLLQLINSTTYLTWSVFDIHDFMENPTLFSIFHAMKIIVFFR